MKPLNTFYDTLQVPRSANDAVIKAAFKALCAQHHPDKSPDDLEGATPEMRLLSEAYAVLSDSEKRFAYDLSLTKREREMRTEEEAKAAKAASMMFPPIVMPSDLPELPAAPVPQPASATVLVPAAMAASSPAPAKVQPPPAPPLRRPAKRAPGALDFEPTTVELPPGEQSGFADTQPQVAADPLQVCSVREAAVPVPGHPAVEWLRERPVALLGVLVLGIALVALAPWALHVFHLATQSKAPVIQDLQPTYVEPPLTNTPAIPLPAAVAPEAAAPEPAAVVADVAESPKAAHNPKRVQASRAKAVMARKGPEPEAPARAPEPAPAPPVLDAGGHSGFAPKCRWVTPTKWSCE